MMDGLFSIDDEIDLSDDDDFLQNISLSTHEDNKENTTSAIHKQEELLKSLNMLPSINLMQQSEQCSMPSVENVVKKKFNFHSNKNSPIRKTERTKSDHPSSIRKDDNKTININTAAKLNNQCNKNMSLFVDFGKEKLQINSDCTSKSIFQHTNLNSDSCFNVPRESSVAEAFNFGNLLDDDDDDLLSEIELPTKSFSQTNSISSVSKANTPYNQRRNTESMLDVFNSTSSNTKLDESNTLLRNPCIGSLTAYSKTTQGIPPASQCTSYNIFPSNSRLKRNSQHTTSTILSRKETYSSNSEYSTPASHTIKQDRFINNITPLNRKTETIKRKLAETRTPKTNSKNTPSRPRKFPGPAGMLPTLKRLDDLHTLKSPEIPKKKHIKTPLTPKTPIEPSMNLSQEDDVTSSMIWQDIEKYLKQHFPRCHPSPITLILNNASCRKLNNGKVELIAGVIKSFSVSGSGGSLILKDPTGQIYGTVHSNVLDEFETLLQHGNGLILKDVSVFSPSTKKHYINITPSNIVQIFSSGINETINMTQVSQLSQYKRSNGDDKAENMDNPLWTKSSEISPPNVGIFGKSNDELEKFFDDDMNI